MGIERTKVDLYTDGSCFQNGAGGWAYRLITIKDGKQIIKDEQGEIVGGATTSQRAEMIAIIAGLRALKVKCEVRIFTDSKSLVDGHARLMEWRKVNRPIVDEDLWKIIEKENARHIIRWYHVKAHRTRNSNPHNDSCDIRAKKMAGRVKDRERRKRDEK